MQADFWQLRWQENRIGFHLPEVNPWLRHFLPKFNLKANSHIFVPLCGKSVDLVYLHDLGYRVTGIEIAEKALKDFFLEQKLAPEIDNIGEFTRYRLNNLTILQGDYFALDKKILGQVDLVFDRASLIALPKSIRADYVRQMLRLIGVCEQIFLISIEYPQDKLAGPPFAVFESEIFKLYAKNFHPELLASKNLSGEGKFAKIDMAVEKAWKFSKCE